MKHVEKLEKLIKQALNFLKEKKVEFYKNNKSSKNLNIIRIIVAVFLLLIAIYAGTRVLVYGIFLTLIAIGVYFLVPDDFLQKLNPKASSDSKPKAVIAKKTEPKVKETKSKK